MAMLRILVAASWALLCASAMDAGRCEGNGYSQLGFANMDMAKCFQRVKDSMQVANCAQVSWNPNKNDQPQCLCFASCSTVSQPDGDTAWKTYTYNEATHSSEIVTTGTGSSVSPSVQSALEVGRCEGNSYSQLGFSGMDKAKCFERVQESMQVGNCARVSWNPTKDNQPQCLCFGSCDIVSQPQGETGWETYTYGGATQAALSGSLAQIAACFGLFLSLAKAAVVL